MDQAKELVASLDPSQIAIILAASFYLIKSLLEVLSKIFFKKVEEAQQVIDAMKGLSANIEHLTFRLTALEIAVDKFEQSLFKLAKLESDMNHAHQSIRDIKRELTSSD